jgi:hypothetical protein
MMKAFIGPFYFIPILLDSRIIKDGTRISIYDADVG